MYHRCQTDFLENCWGKIFDVTKNCTAMSDTMIITITEIHPTNFNYLAKYQTIAKIRTNS